MNLSPLQQDVVNWVVNGKGSANVVARAGCGKTTLLIRGVIRAVVENGLGDISLMAFNKAIADEFKAKLEKMARDLKDPRYLDWKMVEAGTCHSFGFREWKKQMTNQDRNTQVNGNKVRDILEKTPGQYADDLGENGNIYRACGSQICKAVSLAKQSAFGVLCGLEDKAKWYDLLEHHGVNELPDNYTLDDLVPVAITILKQSISLDKQVVDFDDMIFCPLYHKVRFWPRTWVLVDEAQDTNPARRALALAMLRPRTGRLVAVGDDRQAIYGFTGADADAMDVIKNELNSTVLPLNVTYRCPKAVVYEANRLVPDLVAHETAPQGIVRSLPLQWVEEDYQDSQNPPQVGPWFLIDPPAITSAVLCRNTKPLIEQAYSMLRHGLGCRVEGREIGEGLITLAKRWKSIKSLSKLVDKVEDFKQKECQRWLAKGKEDRAQQAEDKCDTLIILCQKLIEDGENTVSALEEFIRSLFGDTKPGEKPKVVVLSTIHKAKGREWPTVYFLARDETLPSRWARKSWQMRQEENLEYVAITRAQSELVYLG